VQIIEILVLLRVLAIRIVIHELEITMAMIIIAICIVSTIVIVGIERISVDVGCG
jgi:hypothetical protein